MINKNPYSILQPGERWAPSQSQMDAFQNVYEKLLPPLVYRVRLAVTEWRNSGYEGGSETTRFLFDFWFNQEHLINQKKFSFFFSQREAIESIVYLYEVAKAKDKYELFRFDCSNRISSGMFNETWTRYVTKMATGAGKTKVIGLTLVWSFFHMLYVGSNNLFFNLETKGREDLDDIRKIQRLATWCKDINTAQSEYTYSPPVCEAGKMGRGEKRPEIVQ